MPKLQNVVLKDRASTPVDHTFEPRDIVDGVGTVVESTGVPIGDSRLTVSLKKTATGNYKARLQLTRPVVETSVVNGVNIPTVTRNAIADVTFTFSSTSTEQERKDCIGMLASALAPGVLLVNDTVTKLQGVY